MSSPDPHCTNIDERSWHMPAGSLCRKPSGGWARTARARPPAHCSRSDPLDILRRGPAGGLPRRGRPRPRLASPPVGRVSPRDAEGVQPSAAGGGKAHGLQEERAIDRRHARYLHEISAGGKYWQMMSEKERKKEKEAEDKKDVKTEVKVEMVEVVDVG